MQQFGYISSGEVELELVPETDDDLCAADGHRYAGDDLGCGRCWCGAQSYPEGGPDADAD